MYRVNRRPHVARLLNRLERSDTTTMAVQHDIDRLIAQFDGDAAFFARNVATGEELGYRADAVMPTASTIKIVVLAEVFRQVDEGAFALDDPLPLESTDLRGGSGILKDLSPDIMLSIRDHATLMIALSDNTSTAALVRLVGREHIQESAGKWGLSQTTPAFNRPTDGDARLYAASTPRDLAHLLTRIATDDLISDDACAAMRDTLLKQQYHDQIGRYLPFSQHQRDGESKHGSVTVRSKSGFMTDPNGAVRVDAGIVEVHEGPTYVLCLMNEHNPDIGYGPEHPGAVLNGRISRLIYDQWAK
jgi:beta-lactamase class A